MPSSSGSLILPLVLWDNKPPNCQISTMMLNETESIILTGTTSGHIIIWEFNIDEVANFYNNMIYYMIYFIFIIRSLLLV
jgi:hypothetical protein